MCAVYPVAPAPLRLSRREAQVLKRARSETVVEKELGLHGLCESSRRLSRIILPSSRKDCRANRVSCTNSVHPDESPTNPTPLAIKTSAAISVNESHYWFSASRATTSITRLQSAS